MQRTGTLLAFLACCLACHSPSSSRALPAPDDGLAELVRSIVTDSLIGGGRREGQHYVAADSSSESALRAARLEPTRRENAPPLACPSSTDAAGQPVAGEVGYVVRIAQARQDSGLLRLQVAVSCAFSYRGMQHGFAQGGIWELRHVEGRWRVTRALGRWVT